MKTQVVILAGGASSRFWPLGEGKHKALFKLMGKPLIAYTLEMLGNLGLKNVIIIQGPDRSIEKEISDGKSYNVKIRYAIQKEAKGMGDALNTARDLIEDRFIVLNPNHYGEEKLIKKMLESKARMVLVGKKTDQPWLYGIFKLDGNDPIGVVEKPEKGSEPSNTRVVGIYLLPKEFFDYWDKVKGKSHYDYELALNDYLAENGKDSSLADLVITDIPLMSLKYPWHLFGMFDYIAEKKLAGKGIVTGDNVQIDPSAKVEGDVYLGKGTKVFENAVIKGPAWIGENCIIGNNALIRGGSNLENKCVVGFGTEVKHVIMQENTHIHSGFVGDSIIGSNTRLAANFITANRRMDRATIRVNVKGKMIDTNMDFFGTIIGDKVRTGINVSTMPGAIIGNKVNIWPNAVIKNKVPSNSIVKVEYNQKVEEK